MKAEQSHKVQKVTHDRAKNAMELSNHFVLRNLVNLQNRAFLKHQHNIIFLQFSLFLFTIGVRALHGCLVDETSIGSIAGNRACGQSPRSSQNSQSVFVCFIRCCSSLITRKSLKLGGLMPPMCAIFSANIMRIHWTFWCICNYCVHNVVKKGVRVLLAGGM